MRVSHLSTLLERLARHLEALGDHHGSGIDYSASVPGFGETRYIIPGLIPHAEFVDRVENAIHWVHVVKDHAKKWVRERGGRDSVIENYINENKALGLCVDLDNTSKHVELDPDRPSRTGTFPQLGKCSLSSGSLVLNRNLKQVVRGVGFVGIEFNDPDLVEYTIPILDQSGNTLAEAGQVLEEAVKAWDDLFVFLGL